MAQSTEQLEEAVSLALNLSAVDRLKLVARVVSSVESDMLDGKLGPEGASQEDESDNWGANLVAMLNKLDLSEWEQMDIPDVGEWVRQLRREESERYADYWKDAE